MRTIKRTLLACLTGLPTAALAQPQTAPTLDEVLAASGIEFSGYVAASYSYLTTSGEFVSGVPSRVYDAEHNSFTLHMVDLTAALLPEQGFGALVDLNFGADPDVHTPLGGDEAVQEAYIQYAQGPLAVKAGQFVTLAGAEVIESPDNFNFSRGILFGYAIPFTHTGIRASFRANPNLSFIFGINNGWDVARDSQSENDKTLEFGVTANPLETLLLSGAIYRGEEPGLVVAGMRTLIDLVASYQITEKLTVDGNVVIAEQEDAVAPGQDAEWRGIAAHVNWQFAPMFRAAGRFEWFEDRDGFRTGVDQKWREVTATLGYMPTDDVELRAEVRVDRSNESAFLETDGGSSKSQESIAFEAIYAF